jgi:hypothetical protein
MLYLSAILGNIFGRIFEGFNANGLNKKRIRLLLIDVQRFTSGRSSRVERLP